MTGHFIRLLVIAGLVLTAWGCDSEFGGGGQATAFGGGGQATADQTRFSSGTPTDPALNAKTKGDGTDSGDTEDGGTNADGEDGAGGSNDSGSAGDLAMDGDGGIDGDGDSAGKNGLSAIQEEIDSDCPYFMSDKELSEAGLSVADVKHMIEGGPPVEVDIRAKIKAGSGAMEDGDYVFTFKVHKVNGKWTNAVTDADRNKKFSSYKYDAIIENARSPKCKVVARLDGETHNDTREGCFLATTKIRMADGTEKQAIDIKIGDRVWNPVLRRAVEVVDFVKGYEKEAGLYEIGIGKSTVVVTATHPFLTSGGVKQAQELTKADKIITEDGKFQPISHLRQRPLDPTVRVANLTIKGPAGVPAHHMVLADGVISGDLHLQTVTEKERKLNRLSDRLARIVK